MKRKPLTGSWRRRTGRPATSTRSRTCSREGARPDRFGGQVAPGRASQHERRLRPRANGEAFLINCHIRPTSAGYANHEPLRSRKVLLHKDQIVRLAGQTAEGDDARPLSIYFKKGRAKIEMGLARKKIHDKREAIRERTAKREVEQAVKAAVRR